MFRHDGSGFIIPLRLYQQVSIAAVPGFVV